LVCVRVFWINPDLQRGYFGGFLRDMIEYRHVVRARVNDIMANVRALKAIIQVGIFKPGT